jgi:hypothetical protein
MDLAQFHGTVFGFHPKALSVFSSPELKAQVSFSDRPLSGICLSVCLSVCKLLYFRLLLQNH